MASVRPMQAEIGQGGRQRGWIPASVWQRQGMSAQEMTLPLGELKSQAKLNLKLILIFKILISSSVINTLLRLHLIIFIFCNNNYSLLTLQMLLFLPTQLIVHLLSLKLDKK